MRNLTATAEGQPEAAAEGPAHSSHKPSHIPHERSRGQKMKHEATGSCRCLPDLDRCETRTDQAKTNMAPHYQHFEKIQVLA